MNLQSEFCQLAVGESRVEMEKISATQMSIKCIEIFTSLLLLLFVYHQTFHSELYFIHFFHLKIKIEQKRSTEMVILDDMSFEKK